MDPNDTQAAGAAEPVQDTSATQTGETGEGVITEAPEATQGTGAEEAPTTEVNAEDTAGEKLFAGKYKSAEDMEKAYTELQSKFSRETSEKAELSRTLNELFATPEPSTGTDTEETGIEEADPLATEVSSLKRVTAVQSFIMAHPEANAAAMKEVLEKDPLIKQIAGHEAKLEYAFVKSQSLTSQQAVEQAKKEGATQAAAKIAEKQAAQVEGAGKATPPNEGSELMGKATGNYGPKEREAARLAIIRKNLVNL